MKHALPHRYVRKRTEKGSILFRCNLPGCTHYLTNTFIDGQESLCHECGNKFVIMGNERYKKLPLCASCRNKRKKVNPEVVVPTDAIAELLNILEVKK